MLCAYCSVGGLAGEKNRNSERSTRITRVIQPLLTAIGLPVYERQSEWNSWISIWMDSTTQYECAHVAVPIYIRTAKPICWFVYLYNGKIKIQFQRFFFRGFEIVFGPIIRHIHIRCWTTFAVNDQEREKGRRKIDGMCRRITTHFWFSFSKREKKKNKEEDTTTWRSFSSLELVTKVEENDWVDGHACVCVCVLGWVWQTCRQINRKSYINRRRRRHYHHAFNYIIFVCDDWRNDDDWGETTKP